MLPVCIFTYYGGAMALPWTVRGARLAGLVPVVFQQHDKPLPGHTLGWLASEGVEVVTTRFNRRGNLNGTDCAAHIARLMAETARRYGTTHAIKGDDDSIIIRPERYTDHLDAGAIGMTWPQGKRYGAFGMAYALSQTVAMEVAEALEFGPLDANAPEDLTVWATAKKFGRTIEHVFTPDGGPFTALPIGADPDDAVARFDVITVGNMPPGGWTDKPRQIAQALRGVYLAAARLMQQP